MGLPLQSLSALGYILLFWPKRLKLLPKLVNTDMRYENMIQQVEEYMKVETTKKVKAKKELFYSHPVNTGDNEDAKKDGKRYWTHHDCCPAISWLLFFLWQGGKPASKNDNTPAFEQQYRYTGK